MTAYPRARRTHWGRRVAITVLVVIALLAAADRIGVVIAQSAVAKTLQDSQHLTHPPDVDIDGFPFLTQLADGHFDKIEISDHDIVVGQSGRSVRLEHVKITLQDVDVARDFTSATATTATAAARIGYADLSSTLGTKLSYAGSGRVSARASAHLGGRTITGTVTATPKLSGHSLEFASPTVTVDGVRAPSEVTALLAGIFGAPIPLDNLPYGLTVRALSAAQDGVSITLTARRLTFRR